MTTAKATEAVGGRLEMSQDVVATIANYAASQVKGVHSLGKAGLNLALDGKSLFEIGPTRGVDAEVGKKQAAIDLEVVIEFGCDIQKVAQELRERIAEAVKQMAGRDVVEVNINVVGIHMPGQVEPPSRRVE